MSIQFVEALRALTDARIEFIVVGGVSAVLHGCAEPTRDLDVCIRPTKEGWAAVHAFLEGKHPRLALTRGWEGSLTYQLDVSPAGRVVDCRITSSSGYDILDQAACRQITRRARFRPAMDQRGAEVAGAYRGSVTWQIPED